MFYKILLIASLVSIGLSGSTDPQKKSNQATYSQSFIREDVPLSYQYSAVHNYVPKRLAPEEPKLTKTYNNPNLKTQELLQKNIQFAPLPNQKEHSYETTGHSSFPKETLYETRPLYTSVFHNAIIEQQQNEYKILENSAPSPPTIKRDHLEPKPLPVGAKNAKPFTYKPHVNHNIQIHQSPHVSSLNNYYENAKHPVNQEQVTTKTAQHLDTGDILKYLNIYQQGLYPEQQATNTRNNVAFTRTERPNRYIAQDTRQFILPKQRAPVTSLLAIPTDPRLAYYKSVPMPVRITTDADKKQEKLLKYSRYNFIRFHPKKH